MNSLTGPRSPKAAFVGALLDWRGTLVVAPTYPWLVETALRRLDRQATPLAVDAVLRRLESADGSGVESSAIDTDAALHRDAYRAWFERAGLDEELSRELYAVESDVAANSFAQDVGPLLEALDAAGVRIGVISDIHVDLRPVFAAQRTSDGRTWAELVHSWVLSYEHGVAKPDQAIFRIALQQLGLTADQVLMVGDRGTHDGAACDVGMTTLLLPPLRSPEDLRLQRVLDLVLPAVRIDQ